MSEVSVDKGTVSGGTTHVQAFRNTRGGDLRDAQVGVDVDEYGNLRNGSTNLNNQPSAPTVTTTASKILDATPAGSTRVRLEIGHEAGSDVYLYFGVGSGKTVAQCYGPISVGGTWGVNAVGVPQGEVWAVVAAGTATIHPWEVFA